MSTTKMKGIYKGFKYISQIFVVKEREIEIGYPTDVRHVAHIGWDGTSGTAPSWMNEYNTSSDYAATSIGNINGTRGSGSAISTWSSQDFESMDRQQPTSSMFRDVPTTDPPNIPRSKQKRKKRSKSKAGYGEDAARPANIEVV